MKKSIFLVLSMAFITGTLLAQKVITLVSPNGKVTIELSIGKTLEYSVSHQGDVMLSKSPMSLKLTDGRVFGVNLKLKSAVKTTVNTTIDAFIYKKNKIVDNYNQLILKLAGDYSVVFRAYNDGVAYRFQSDFKKPFEVESEQVVFNFPENQKAYVPYVNKYGDNSTFEKQFQNSFENIYKYISLSEWSTKQLAFLPLVVEGINGKKVCITESDLFNYPGMYLNNNDASNTLKGVFAPYPKELKQGGHNLLQALVQTTEKYIAKCEGKTSFPWRVIVVAENDSELTNSDMVYKLATPAQFSDVSWIKPGKVAWDWWNDWNIVNVDFQSGTNTATYKYYIDFASKYGIEYVILDEGWAVNLKADLYQVIPEIDLKELVAYAKLKNVDLILWAGYYAFNKDIEGICKHYSEMGIKGFKVDFMDRDDQLMVDFLNVSAKIAAKYKMLVDFHGIYKPTGLQRTYPNVINFEGVHGLEQMKWSPNTVDQVTYDVTMPFIRMVAGPIDYTQGAMRNSTKKSYFPNYSEPMSQGTRCHQLAEYIIFESPLNMLCDNPSNYMSEDESTKFIAKIPTTWNNTISLNGEIAKYVTIARQKGDVWYVGALNNWDARSLDLDLSFLGDGQFSAEVFRDGANANRAARDYKREVIEIPASKKLKISMASGGGYIMCITKK